MKSSTNRALVAKKQSTFSAFVANSIKNLLQGYTKGIRIVAVLTMLLTIGVGQTWAEGTETFENLTSASGYASRNWTGVNGQTWKATLARTDQKITGNRGLTFSKDASGKTITMVLTEAQRAAGIGTFTFKYKHPYSDSSKNNTFSISVNGSNYSSGTLSYTSSSKTKTITINAVPNSTSITITITGTARLCVDDFSWTSYASNKTVYLKPTSAWDNSSAKFAVYYFNNSTNGWSSLMTKVDNKCNNDVYKAEIPSSYTNLIFVRLNNTATAGDWNKKWDQTADLTLSGTNNMYTISAHGSNGGKASGSWSAYKEEVQVTYNFQKTGISNITECVVKGQTTSNKSYNLLGWKLEGWYREAACTNQWNFSTTVTSDTTLYAKWSEPATTTVYLNANSNGVNWTQDNADIWVHAFMSSTGEYKDIQLTPVNTCDVNWLKAEGIPYGVDKLIFLRVADGAGVVWSGSNLWNQAAEIGYSGSTSYYQMDSWSAVKTATAYQPSTYTISYNNGGGTGSMASTTVECDGSIKLPANSFTRTGYTFNGWKDAGGKTYTDEATISNVKSNITLTAQWKANTYDVKFNANNGTGSMSNQTFIYDAAQNLTANAFSRTGYLFAGWNTKADGSGTSYADKASVKNLSSTNGAIVNLYAKWTPITYSINWVVNGAAYDKGGSTEAVHNSTYNNLTLPTPPDGSELEACYDNKVFVGWSTTDVGYTETDTMPTLLAEEPTTPITADTTFYAVFATGTGGGTSTVSLFSEDFSSIISGNSTTTNGSSSTWNTNDNFSDCSRVYQAGGAVKLGASGNPGYLVTKQLTAAIGDKLTISFKVKGWSSVEGDIQVSGNNSEFAQPAAITYTSTMSGSFETKTVSVVLTKANPYIKIATTAKRAFIDDIVITKTTTAAPDYSGYVSKCYCVTGIELSMTGGHQNLDVGDKNQLLVTYTPDDATCGNEIATWTSSNDNVISVDDQGLVTANMAGNATITATTTNGISNTYNITVNNPDCEAWYIHYWNNSTSGDECFYKVKPDDPNDHEWRTNNFSLPSFSNEDMFIVNNAQAAGGDSQKTDQIFRTGIGFADIQRGGYTCGNPYPGQDAYGQLSIYDDSNSPNRYIAFYPAQYMVTFGKEGSSWEEMPLNNTTGYEYESEPFMVPNGYKTDDTYKYWVGITDKDGNIKYVGYEFDGVEYKKSSVDAMNTVNGLSTSDMAGKWGVWHIWSNSCANNWYAEFIRYYRVDFDLAGGEGDIAPRYGKATTPYVTFSTTDITAPTRDGYTFLGWEDQNGNTYSPTESTVTINDDLTLTAQWAQNHTLTYDLAGGDGTACDAATTYYTGESFTVCSGAGEKTGYTFNGWLGSDGNTYNASGTYTMPDEDLTITAQWTRDTYTITWNVAGEETPTPIGTGDALSSIMPDDPTSCSDTYTTFVGWYTAASGMETSPSTEPQGTQVTASTVPEGNVTYYAVWADAAAGGGGWSETELANISSDDVVVITMENSGSYYALSSANGSSSSPAATAVTVSNNAITSEVGDTYKWNIANSDGTLTIYPNGSTTSWLYCTNSNSGVRVGTNGNKAFIIEQYNGNSFLYNTATSRYLGVYDNKDWRCYELSNTGLTSNINAQTLAFFKAASSATGYISSCCQSPAVVTVTPASSSLELNLEGTASTSVYISQSGGGNGRYYEPTVSPADGASLGWSGSYKMQPYDINFTATKAGKYTVTGNFTETIYGCQKTGSATITVVANPILQVSEPTITSECGTEGTPVAVTIDSRYLTGSSLTAQVATTTDTEHGVFKICTMEDGTFGTSNLTNLTAGKDDKASITIYVRYDAIEDENTEATGTLTITDGTTSQTVDLTTTPTCGTSIRMTPTDANSVRVTTANGQWTRTQTAIHLRGSYLLQNLTGDQGAKVELTSSNSNFKFVKPDVASSGTVKYESEKITDNTWEADVYLVYTPTSYDANETTTITAKVVTFSGTTEHATTTLTAYGRSFPETFVLALNTGSEWVALPADMIAPYGTNCTTGVGNHDPYPITVNDNDNPTTATLAPARAVYKGAARNTPETNPWTIQFESNTQAGYYLFGSVHNDDANTSIANLEQATGEGLKWELNTEDNITYRLSQMNAPAFQLGYNATANYMGQYQSTANNFKYDFRILPVTSTCTYYIEPVMTLVDYTDDEAKVRIQYDGTNLYQISTDNKANWTNVTGEIDCLDLTFTLPNTTYRGTDVWLKPQGDLCELVESSASCHIPAPVINNPGDQNFVGTVNQPFSGTFTITGSDLYQDISAIYIKNNSNSTIGATIDNGTITVTMAAAAVGTYTTYLTFDAVGAEDVTVKVTITIQDLAIMQITPADIIDGVYCCLDGNAPTFTFSPIYVNGTPITTAGGASNGTSTFSVIDLDDNNATVNATYSVSSGAVTLTVPLANLTLTHRYQVSYTNLNDGDKTSAGLPYANASYTFTAINCNTITALPACPITNSGFTANWVGDATKLNVYTKSETEVLAAAMTETTINVWRSYSNSYADEWLGASSDGTDNIPKHSTYGAKVAGSGESGYIYTPQLGTLKADMTNSTEFEVTITVYHYNSNSNTNSIKCFVIDGEPTNTTEPTSGNNVYFNGTQNTSWTSTTFGNVNTTDVTFIVSGLTSTSRIAITATNRINSTYVKNVTIKSVATSSVGVYDVTGTSHDVSGLTPNTQYYYTVTDGSSNTSNEIAVTTYSGSPSLKFYNDENCTVEITETTVFGGEETTVYVEGTKVPGCDIATSVSSGYGMDDSGLNYNITTGAVTGSIILTLTDANTTEGTLTLTDGKGNTYVLPIVSSDCPAGFGTMALPASDIDSESAQANWTSTLDFGDDKSGTLHLYKNGIVNRELIVNGDFETGTLTAGWSNGLNGGDKDAVYSFSEFDIVSSNVHDEGSYCLSVTGNGSKLLAFQNMSVMYADSIILTAGTYRMSAWVKMPEASGYDDKKQSFALGLIGGKKSAVKVVCVSDITIVQSNNTYVQLTYEFTLTSTVTACPAIGANVRGETFRDFYLDDVSLMCTSIGQSDEPYLSIDIDDLSEDGFLALTGLSGNTEYTYVIQNADGCSSNSITFQTTEAGAPVIEPNDVTISCQVGNSVNGLMTLSVKDVYSDIYISNSCTERITLNTTKLPKEGGVVNFTFTPLNTDQGGETGTCTISFTTKGLATPATGIITWTVTAGKDPNQPIVEVVDITNQSMDIEHNQGNGNDVHIVISREKGEDEIEENLGEEIFFSKYYEAYMHKKLWAIYNPTNHKISLTNTYVWRSNGNSDDWNIEGGMDLSSLGNIEPGYIHPNEEIIIYTSDQVGECEQGKADMSDWVAMSSSDPALSFSGNDALLLVRKADGTNDPPKWSVELDEEGNPYELSWRKYTADDTQWWMLDIIGARKNNNTPDNSATYKWTWTCGDKTETGDADGWVGTGEHLDATLYTDCPYILSTNRCLLIRKMTVKSGYKAIQTNVNDMFTLNTEWRGVHVPLAGEQAKVSCENFSFVGGYDYDGYYNAWTPIDEMEHLEATQNDDGSYTVTPIHMPQYYCHPLRIEVYITENVNGEEIDNVKAYLDYKVPIVVDYDAYTNDQDYFIKPDDDNTLTDVICAECDVVIRDGATLTHIDDGREAFRNMQVYPTAKFNIPENLSMQLAGLHMYAKNDDVGYAILNDNGSSIHADNIVHIKRIDDKYWYPFSLPYDCKISTIRQLNGKSMGEYGWGDTSEWGIKCYDGYQRQADGRSANAGEVSEYWDKLDASATLKANQGYIIGLFTTEWDGQMKSIYFPPVESTEYTEYTESGDDAKTTYISNWYTDNMATVEARHRGWNFTSLPYISLFENNTDDGVNNTSVIMGGNPKDNYATPSTVYVSIPDGGDSRTYTQVSAAATKLEPFKPYFVQAIDPKDGQSHNDIPLTYSKGGRTLEKMPARAASNVRPTIVVEMRIANADASLVDNAGVLVSERYTANYEIAADLTKMYAADRKPQLFTRAANNNEMLAYNALPDPLAQNIPLGIYLPNNDEYTISIIDYASQLSDAEAVYLLHNGEIVANLLYADYTIPTQQAGLINGYSLDIRRRQNAPTNIDNIADGGPVITVVDGQIVIQQLPEDAQLHITDVLGRVLYQQANVPHIITFQAPVTGVYNVVITTAEQQFTQKTIVR